MTERNQAYRLNFKSIGMDVTIWDGARVVAPERITIGNSVIVDDFVLIMAGDETQVGSFVHIAAHAALAGGGKLVVEDFAGISGGSRIYTGNDDYLGGSLTGPTVPEPYRKPIRSFVHIKKHCIVGANSVVLPGVTIGEGTTIGANSVVTRDCDEWMVYAGAPAKPIKERARDAIYELERALRRDLYDEEGRYIPKELRGHG